MNILVGYTGFIGSNLHKQKIYDDIFNSKNIEKLRNKEVSHMVFAGLPGAKWKANSFAKEDLENIENIISCLKQVKAEKVTYISTIDVYQNPSNVDEDTCISLSHQPYGANRAYFEKFMMSNFSNCLSIRLPIVFGSNFKKNYLFDIINKNNLQNLCLDSSVQFYHVDDLSNDIEMAWKENKNIFNFATQPITLREITNELFPEVVKNCTSKDKFFTNMKTKHRINGYIYEKYEILNKISKFINS